MQRARIRASVSGWAQGHSSSRWQPVKSLPAGSQVPGQSWGDEACVIPGGLGARVLRAWPADPLRNGGDRRSREYGARNEDGWRRWWAGTWEVLHVVPGREPQPTAAILESRTVDPSTAAGWLHRSPARPSSPLHMAMGSGLSLGLCVGHRHAQVHSTVTLLGRDRKTLHALNRCRPERKRGASTRIDKIPRYARNDGSVLCQTRPGGKRPGGHRRPHVATPCLQCYTATQPAETAAVYDKRPEVRDLPEAMEGQALLPRR